MGRVALVVDDDLLARRIIGMMLEADGWTVLQAADGAAGLTQAREARPQVILLDVMMPDLDGYEVYRRLKRDAATKDIPVVFITASAERDQRDDLAAAQYLRKPVRPETLLRTVTAATAAPCPTADAAATLQ